MHQRTSGVRGAVATMVVKNSAQAVKQREDGGDRGRDWASNGEQGPEEAAKRASVGRTAALNRAWTQGFARAATDAPGRQGWRISRRRRALPCGRRGRALP